MSLKPGAVLKNRYRIENVLGQGGMGAVYRAYDVNLGVVVAVKENLFTTDEYARQFKKEATILASLRHPNLPRVTDHFVIEGEGQYLVMDFIQGEDLREKLEQGGPVPEDLALPWFMDICDALAYLHTRTSAVLHRDIKPGNIKITPDGRAILVDFGLAKVVEESGTTTTGAKAMTPGFSPPEQYGTGRTDARTDIYSLGATMYAALTATIPEDSLERAMGRENLTPVRKKNPEVSASLARAIEKALAIRPEDRYQSVHEYAMALNQISGASRPTVIKSYPCLERTVTVGEKTVVHRVAERAAGYPRRKARIPVLGAMVVALALTAAGTVYAIPDFRDRLAALFAPYTATAPPPKSPQVTASPPTFTPTPGFVFVDLNATPPPTTPPTAVLNLTQSHTPEAGSTPAPTPIGGGVGQIAFVSTRSGLAQIYLTNVDGTGLLQITSLQDGACQPAWSPDGMRLLLTSPCRRNQERYEGSSLWLISIDSSGHASDPSPLPSAPGGEYDPAWAPDGERISFTSLRDGPPGIFVMNLDGTGLTKLSTTVAYENQSTWSPTGTQLVFTSQRGGVQSIWTVPASGGEAKRFSRSEPYEDMNPDWSSHGQLIVFERRMGGVSRLVAAKFEDRGLLDFRVCPEGFRSTQPMSEPSWSPDARWVAFETWPDGTNHNLGILTLSCTNYAELTSDPAFDFDPAWRP